MGDSRAEGPLAIGGEGPAALSLLLRLMESVSHLLHSKIIEEQWSGKKMRSSILMD